MIPQEIRLDDSEKVLPERCVSVLGMEGCETYAIDKYTIGVRPRWISVKDQFPPIEERVLVYQKGGVHGGCEVDIDYRTHENYPDEPQINNQITWHDQGISNNIHFWMPLPTPPEE